MEIDSGVVSEPTVAGGYIQHNYASNDIVLTMHPYPALGLATSRVVCPQDGDTTTHDDSYYIDVVVNTVPATDNVWLMTHKEDASHYLLWIFGTGGNLHLYHDIGAGLVWLASAGAASYTDADKVTLLYDRATAKARALVNGAEVIAWTSCTAPVGATTAEVDIRNAADAGALSEYVAWPLNFNWNLE